MMIWNKDFFKLKNKNALRETMKYVRKHKDIKL